MKSEHLVGTSIPRFTYDTPTVPGNDFYALCEGCLLYTSQLQPVRGVHAAAGQQGLVALKDEGQLTELTALGSAGTGQLCQLLAGKARAFQLVDGLSRHLEMCIRDSPPRTRSRSRYPAGSLPSGWP